MSAFLQLYDDEGHDDLEVVDHVLLPDVHQQGLVLVGSLHCVNKTKVISADLLDFYFDFEDIYI